MEKKSVKLTFVNVGYGEAILLECPASDGGTFTALIDGGSAEDEEFADCSSGRIPVWEYLASRNIDKINLMISTHPHEDHICGLLRAAQLIPPDELWQAYSPDFYKKKRALDTSAARTPSQSKFMRALNDYVSLCGIVNNHGGVIKCVGAGDEISICDGIKVSILAPDASDKAVLEEMTAALYEDIDKEEFLKRLSGLDARMNNYSIILRLDCGNVKILLPGDTNREGFGKIDAIELRADIFKIGHHGQIDSVDAGLLEKVKPSVVVCCASSDRRYNSAHPDVIRMLAERGAKSYFSDCPDMPKGMAEVPPHKELIIETDESGRITCTYKS